MPSDSASAAARPSILGKTSDPVARPLMTKTQFKEATNKIGTAFPGLRLTSTFRTEAKNVRVKGHRLSKHQNEMASDFVGSPEDMQAGLARAHELGLSAKVHDAGSGMHLHTQGMTPGRVTQEWLDQNPLTPEAMRMAEAEESELAELEKKAKKRKQSPS